MLKFNQVLFASFLFAGLTALALGVIYCLGLTLVVLVSEGSSHDIFSMMTVVYAFVFAATGVLCYCAFWTWPLVRRFLPGLSLRREGYVVVAIAAVLTNLLMALFTQNLAATPLLLNLVTSVAGTLVGGRIYATVWKKLRELKEPRTST